MVRDGHAVGNHSWNHPILFGKSAVALRRQFTRTQKVLDAAVGAQPMLGRPPFGQLNKRVEGVRRRLGAPVILWDVDPRDLGNH